MDLYPLIQWINILLRYYSAFSHKKLLQPLPRLSLFAFSLFESSPFKTPPAQIPPPPASRIAQLLLDRLVRALLTTKDPHEQQLDDKSVDGEEVGATGLLRAGHGVRGAGTHGGVVGTVRQEDVFQGAELVVGGCVSLEFEEGKKYEKG